MHQVVINDAQKYFSKIFSTSLPENARWKKISFCSAEIDHRCIFKSQRPFSARSKRLFVKSKTMKSVFKFTVLCLFASVCRIAQADLSTAWDIGEKVTDFSASAIDPVTQSSITKQWYNESGADVYIVSTCAMWCNPCQLYGIDSQTIVQNLAAEGINAQAYDFIFQDPIQTEPDELDAHAWIDNIWTSDPGNVWFGGQISTLANDSVTTDIFEAVFNAGGSGSAIPAIAILDRNFVVRDLIEGYSQTRIESSARSAAAIPEPSAIGVLITIGGFLTLRMRTKKVEA